MSQSENLIGRGRRAAVPEEQNPKHWGADGRLTYDGMRAMLRAGHSVRLGDKIIASEAQLPSVSEYALMTGNQQVVAQTAAQLDAEIQRLLAERQRLVTGTPQSPLPQPVPLSQMTGPQAAGFGAGTFSPQQQPATAAGFSPQQAEKTGIPPNMPATGSGLPAQNITGVSQPQAPSTGEGAGTPSPSTSGTMTADDVSKQTAAEGGDAGTGGAGGGR